MFRGFGQVGPSPFSVVRFVFRVQPSFWCTLTSKRPVLREERHWTTATSSNSQDQSPHHLLQSLKEILSCLQVMLIGNPSYCRSELRPCHSWRSYPLRCQTPNILRQVFQAPHCWRALLFNWLVWPPLKFKLLKLNFTLNYIQATQSQYRLWNPFKQMGFHVLWVQTSFLIWNFYCGVISNHCQVVSSYLTF